MLTWSCNVTRELREELRNALGVDLDDVMKDLLTHVLLHEPTTLYRISKSTQYAISTVYKKARKMLSLELIRPLNSTFWTHGNGRVKSLYEITVKGLLTCLAYNCVNDDVVLNRLISKWRIRGCPDLFCELVQVVPRLIKLMGPASFVEDVGALLMTILNNAEQLRGIFDEGEFERLVNLAVDFIIKRVSNVLSPGYSTVISNDYFTAMLCNDGRLYVCSCRLCDSKCVGRYANGNCKLVQMLEKLVTNIQSGI